ncbi:hypothetical protein Ahy_B01g056124 [Arachis hypogaea]|uniref:Cystatin domain-containing protein n=1 Tax=Arachis hypogaea TaxID=3818 RepID=A0A445AY45_ARAHY|nr:hypothetical protein Ahy_B01g056124 [Arachis hypogaea]
MVIFYRFQGINMMRLECHVYSLLLVLFVIITIVASRKETSRGLIRGWTPISNVNDPHVLDIAQFAVTKYNKQYLVLLSSWRRSLRVTLKWCSVQITVPSSRHLPVLPLVTTRPLSSLQEKHPFSPHFF